MTKTESLTRRWIDLFGEPPAVADAELMLAVLADMGVDAGDGSDREIDA